MPLPGFSMIPETLAHYRIVSKLGAGGMGEVYLAEDTQLGRRVALKLLPPALTADAQAKKRLVREAQAAAALDHPNICSIYAVGEDAGRNFIVLQYVEGETLAARISKKPLAVGEALDLAAQIADALAEAHSRGIVHRDIKPANIMITPRGQARVMDFGLAKLVDEKVSLASAAATESLLTTPGAIVGTVPYMSPEQLTGADADARSDLFSFGSVLYEMVTGRRAFAAEHTTGVIAAVLTDQPAPLARYADAPQELERIVRKCLAKNPEERYQSARDLLVDLRNLRNAGPSPAASGGGVDRRQRGGRRWILAAGAVVVVAVCALAVRAVVHSGQVPSEGIRRLAVLPMANAGGDAKMDYLSDGITESLINSLSQLSQLKVIARTTAFRYKGKDADPQAIGRDLRVDAVVTGRVVREGENLVVQADLLNTADGSEIWGERYARKLSDVFGVQEQIAMEIAGSLRLKLTGAQKEGLAKRYTANVGAYESYLRGQAHIHRRTREDMLAAIEDYDKAVAEDPNYALAYAGQAEAYANLGTRGYLPPSEGRKKAEASVAKALALDGSLAEAQVVVGEIHVLFAPYDFSIADTALRRAIAISPSLASAHQYLGNSYVIQGRLDEAIGEFAKARELDPLSAIIPRAAICPYYLKGDYANALNLLRKADALGPSFTTFWEVGIYVQNKLYGEGLALLEKERRERGDDPLLTFSAGRISAAQGNREEVQRIIRTLEGMPGPALSQAYYIAQLYAASGDSKQALAWLDRGLAAGEITFFLKDDPVWNTCRRDPQFARLIRAMHLPG